MLEKWIIPSYTYSTKEPQKVENVPTISGKYLVIIEGEKIYDDGGWQIDGFDSYETVMNIKINNGEIQGEGLFGENWDCVLGWIGPIPPIPEEVI